MQPLDYDMARPDIVISWPNNCDYPLWRQFIHDNRYRFNNVIIVFTETNTQPDYKDFVRKAMLRDWCLFVQSPAPNSNGDGRLDWRDVAVNAGLLHSYNAEWIWFTEQDFFTKNDFWEHVKKGFDQYGAMGVYDGERLHPCCLFIKREVLNNTCKNFAANPPEFDHFGAIQRDLTGVPVYVIPQASYHHMAGLSHNWRQVAEGGTPNYKPEEFNNYLKSCLQVTVPLDPQWQAIAEAYLQRI